MASKQWKFLVVIILTAFASSLYAVERIQVDMGVKKYPHLIFVQPSYFATIHEPVVNFNKIYKRDVETDDWKVSVADVEKKSNYHVVGGWYWVGNEVINDSWNAFAMFGVDFGKMPQVFYLSANTGVAFGQIELYSQKIRYSYFEWFAEPLASLTIVKHPLFSLVLSCGIPWGFIISSYDLNYDPYKELEPFSAFAMRSGVECFIQNTVKFSGIMFSLIPGMSMVMTGDTKYSEDVKYDDYYEHYFTIPGEKIYTYFIACKLFIPVEKDDALVLGYSYNYRPKSTVTEFPALEIHYISITASINVKDTVTEVKEAEVIQEDSIIL